MKSKNCSDCKEDKLLSAFSRNRTKKDGIEGQCKECRKTRKRRYVKTENGKKKAREYYWRNIEKERARLRKRSGTDDYIDYQRKYREQNIEKVREYRKRWTKENYVSFQVKNHIYFAKAKGLEINWDEHTYRQVLNDFKNSCCLSGETEKISMDHFVAITTGHCGTYKGNMIPLSISLNQSKGNKNPFEWIKNQSNDIQNQFVKVVEALAKDNGLSVADFRKFVYWCYENPRLEQMKESNTTSIELWKTR